MDNWEKLKCYINNAANTKPNECGHGKVAAFREIKELMSLIEKDDDKDVIIENNSFKFECSHASIVFGRDIEIGEDDE